MSETMRYILGYLFGMTVFLFLVPFGLYELSKLDILFGNRVMIGSATVRTVVSLPIFLAGAFFAIWSNIYLFKIGKGGPAEGLGISISPRTKRLVTSGPYRYSRNPMVFGAFSLYVSIALFLDSMTGLICLFVFLPVGIVYLKVSEEKRLLKDFGDEFIEYKKSVSMLFPLKKSRKQPVYPQPGGTIE
jgi:protein-S-isoprenylcysteine O-methyltransferase Ste14